MYTYTSDSNGYMLFKDGKPIGGAGVIVKPWEKRHRHWRHTRANIKLFADSAQRQCEVLNGAENNRVTRHP